MENGYEGKSSSVMCDQKVRDAMQYKLGVDIPSQGQPDTAHKAYQVAELAGKLGPNYRGPTSPMPPDFPNPGAISPMPAQQVPAATPETTVTASAPTGAPTSAPVPQSNSALPTPASTISTGVGSMLTAPQGATDLLSTADLLMKKQAAANQSNSLTS